MAGIGTVNGIPLLRAGTYPLKGEAATDAVLMAIESGIRHLDTAQKYGNELDVGRAIKLSGLPRNELFVVTKVDPGNSGKERFASSVMRSADDLGGPADLLLIHWPPDLAEFDAVLDRLLGEYEKGMARAIGVSNFSPGMMRRAQKRTVGAIVNNQVEFHPLLDQRALLAAAGELGIALSAFSPLARGAALKPPAVQSIAKRLDCPASAVVLRWILQQGVIAIPMTTRRENIHANLGALDIALTREDMATISALCSPEGRHINPGRMAGRWDE